MAERPVPAKAIEAARSCDGVASVEAEGNAIVISADTLAAAFSAFEVADDNADGVEIRLVLAGPAAAEADLMIDQHQQNIRSQHVSIGRDGRMWVVSPDGSCFAAPFTRGNTCDG